MTSIYDAVRIAIEHRLAEDMRSTEILGNIPFYVQRAATNLQQKNIIPPVQKEYTNDDLITYTNLAGTELYDYILLDDNFRELSKLFVNEVEPEWYHSLLSLKSAGNANPAKVLYNVGTVDIEGTARRALALANVPSDSVVTINYHKQMDEATVQTLDEKYWEAIIAHVEAQLNLPTTQAAILNDQRAKDQAEELAVSLRNQTQIIFRTRPNFFGNYKAPKRLRR
jgi:hypothetical protein